jgi:Tol biopolymer transport system component
MAIAAAALVIALALTLGLWRFVLGGTPGLRQPGEVATGPPVPGARGRLAFIRGGDVWTYDLAKGIERRLTRDGGNSAPRWSGNGAWLSLTRGGRLWAIRADGSTEFAVPGGDVPASARWAPRGSRLAYASSDGSLSVLDPAQGERGRRVLVPPGRGAGPRLAWSQDGTRIAFEQHQPAGPGLSHEGIWSIGATGRDQLAVYLASGDFSLHLCCWTATGGYLLFWRGTASASLAADGLPLLVSRARSSEPVRVSAAALPYPDWVAAAPRLDALALVVGAGREATSGKSLVAALLQAGRDGAIVVQTNVLESDPGSAPGSPAWAPPGTTIAYSSGPSLSSRGGDLAASLAGRRIWLVQADGSARRPLLADATIPAGVSDERPLWARDGRTLVFVRRLQPDAAARNGSGQAGAVGAELWVALADGSGARRVAGGLPDPGFGYYGHLDWGEVFDYLGA